MKSISMKNVAKKLFCSALVLAFIGAMVVSLTACNKDKLPYVRLGAQADIFVELNAQTADVGILDHTMAKYLLATDSSLSNNVQMIENLEFDAEDYGVAFRKGSLGLCDKVNQALSALKDTEVATIATTYGLTENLKNLSYTASETLTAADNADWAYIASKGKVIIGYTLNAPMAIKATNGSLSGFDIDLPRAVFAWINTTFDTSIQVEFQLIDWSQKENELNAKTIDIIWNGMTITDARAEAMTISTPYLVNKQVVLIRKTDAGKYTTKESLKSARIVVEGGSAGEDIAKSIFGIK